MNYPNTSTSHVTEENQEDEQITEIREIHALTPQPTNHGHNHRSSSVSITSTTESDQNFTTMSREFTALVLAGQTIDHNNISTPHEHEAVNNNNNNNNLGRIGEDDMMVETNPLAIVADNNPLELNPVASPTRRRTMNDGVGARVSEEQHVSVQRVKKEEVDTKISAWQNAKVAKINNRFKREDAVINGWENEQVQKATSWMKKVEVNVFSLLLFFLTVLFACWLFFFFFLSSKSPRLS